MNSISDVTVSMHANPAFGTFFPLGMVKGASSPTSMANEATTDSTPPECVKDSSVILSRYFGRAETSSNMSRPKGGLRFNSFTIPHFKHVLDLAKRHSTHQLQAVGILSAKCSDGSYPCGSKHLTNRGMKKAEWSRPQQSHLYPTAREALGQKGGAVTKQTYDFSPI